MNKNTSFSIGEHFSSFVSAQVSQGRYGNASDVVRAALRLLEEREAKLDALRAALVEGEESGPRPRSTLTPLLRENARSNARKHDVTQRYTLSPKAQSDIDEIWHYIENRWGTGQAEKYIRQLARDMRAIAAQPALARPCLRYGTATLSSNPAPICCLFGRRKGE
jgi:antitoxin ParD1/3/4